MISQSKRLSNADKKKIEIEIIESLRHFHNYGSCHGLVKVLENIPSEKNKVRLVYWLYKVLFFAVGLTRKGRLNIRIEKKKREQAKIFRGSDFEVDSFGHWYDMDVPEPAEESIKIRIGLKKRKKKRRARARIVSGGLPGSGRRS